MAEKHEKTSATLTDDEISAAPRVGRRSALGLLGATLLGAAAVTLPGREARAQQGPNDNDSGPNADAPGRGVTGHSDRDSGPSEDRPNHGVCALRGTTDSDAGPSADGPRRGRGPCR